MFRTSPALALVLGIVSTAAAPVLAQKQPAPPPAQEPAAKEPAAKEPPGPAAKEEAAPPPSRAELEKLLAETDAIAKTVSKLRGLPVKKKITRGIMSRPEIEKRLLERIADEYTPGELASEGRALERLGLLPSGTDYEKLVLDLLTEQIAGFYDPTTRELYLADWIDVDTQRMVMAHEIDHALQDQSFALEKFAATIKDDADQQLARSALIEGDGTALMIEFEFHESKIQADPWTNDLLQGILALEGAVAGMAAAGSSDKLGSAPLFIRESLMFPYLQGLKFVAHVRRTQPWSAVDRMFKKPPLSTEHILHPEKYERGEKPIAVKAAKLPTLKGATEIYKTVLGELGMAILLRQHGVEVSRASRAAAGWGGDRLVVYAPEGDAGGTADLVAVSLSAWDAEMDAIEAFEALEDAVLTMTAAKTHQERSATVAIAADAAGDLTIVERKGSAVLLLVGAPADLATKLRADVWAKWKK